MKIRNNDNTVPTSKKKRATRGKLGATAQLRATAIAMEADILGCFRNDLRAGGFAGELSTATALYLVLSSRVLDEPVSGAVKGESAAGKSYAVSAVANFFPKRASLAMTSASDKALFHLKVSLRHRVLIFGEQHGMSSERLNYYIRELLSNGCIQQYAVRPGKGGHTTERSRTMGPTSFITTATNDLHPENETRLLALRIDESRRATKKIMLAVARTFNHSKVKGKSQYSLEDWKTFQTWQAAQPNKVHIPFAETLAELIDPNSLRWRRDIGKLINLVATHALLHRQTRRIGPNGVVAKIADYRAIWKVLRKSFALSVEQSIDPSIRETVEAVRAIRSTPVTMDALAKQLGVDKSNAGRRYRKAAEAGFLMNRGRGAGHPYAIDLAAPLPDDDAVLPSPKALSQAVKAARLGGKPRK